jgi:hypothetical protein
MSETLLRPSGIKLFGRVMKDLKLNLPSGKGDEYDDEANGDNNFLKKQLEHKDEKGKPDAQFARIYGFSYEGRFYDLPKPTIFLVHGPGKPVKVEPSTERTSTSTSGVAAKDWEFSAPSARNDLVSWDYDKADYSIRLDTETGQLEQILLEAAMRASSNAAEARSGMAVSGMAVSGMAVSGMALRGKG